MNRPLPSSEMSLKLRRSKTEDGLLSSREERSHLLRGRDESRDSAFFSLNNTSLCLSPELKQPEESDQEIGSSVYQQHQVPNDLPKPLYLEVCSTQSPLTTFPGAQFPTDGQSETGMGVGTSAGVVVK